MALRIAQLAARSPKGWHVLDASNASLGRVAAKAATLLTGKHKAVYHPSAECGDYVVVVNVEDAAVTDKKLDTKLYRWHTQYAGGLKEVSMRSVWEKRPQDVLRSAVWGMLPKNKNRKRANRNLFVYRGGDHPFADEIAQWEAEAADAESSRALAPEHSTLTLGPDDDNTPVKDLLLAVGSRVSSLPEGVRLVPSGASL